MLDLARSDTEGKSAERPVCGCMTVTADNGGAGEGEALLWADDMDDALTLVAHAKVCDTKVLDILLEYLALYPGVVFFDELGDGFEVFARGGGNVLRQGMSLCSGL